jgi:uncharacterized protein YbjT (DUF2867 family)
MTTNTTLVIGGTGKTGHRAAGRLAARGLPVPVGFPLRRTALRLGEPATWAPALGVRSAQLAVRPPLQLAQPNQRRRSGMNVQKH